jgi:hypothetical protein
VLSGVQLRVVPIDSIHPHESADPGREERIERRIAGDGMLRDPLLVGAIPEVDGYILLDGTNRREALERLGLPLAMVQVIDYADHTSIELRTWCHAAPTRAEALAAQAEGIDGVQSTQLSPLAAQDALSAPGTLAVILDPHQRYAITTSAVGASRRIDALRAFVDLYERSLTRTDCDHEAIEDLVRSKAGSGDPVTLIAFPPVTRGQVVGMAMEGLRIPAGITRHIILGGRALRVNLSLEVLALNDVVHANEALTRHLAVLHPRVYQEPTVLFDS